MEFSKIIVIAVSILTAIISCFSMVAMLIMQDISALPILITTVFAAFATGTGFYYNKAKAENLKKISKEIQEEEIDEESIKKAKMLMSEEIKETETTNYDY